MIFRKVCILLVLCCLTSFAQQKQQKLDRVDKLPTGPNTNVFGTFAGGLGGIHNKTDFLFDAPYDQVWMAAKVAARDFDKNSGRPVIGIDEQNNRIQNGRVDRGAMTKSSGLRAFVDEFVTQITIVSDTQTKVTVFRNVMQKESSRLWGPQKSNGKIERYLLTQIEDNLKKLPATTREATAGANASSTSSGPPRDYATTAPGTYLRQGKPADYIEFGSDGSFFLKQDGRSAAGTYKVSGDIGTLVLPNGQADRGRFNGDTLIDSNGTVWVKKAESQKPAARITNDQIIQMVAAKLPEDVIIAAIRSSSSKFDLSPDALIKLKQTGVTDAVIQLMVEVSSK